MYSSTFLHSLECLHDWHLLVPFTRFRAATSLFSLNLQKSRLLNNTYIYYVDVFLQFGEQYCTICTSTMTSSSCNKLTSQLYCDDPLQLTPTNICEFFCFNIYGTTIPGPYTKPQFGRSTSLKRPKKYEVRHVIKNWVKMLRCRQTILQEVFQ